MRLCHDLKLYGQPPEVLLKIARLGSHRTCHLPEATSKVDQWTATPSEHLPKGFEELVGVLWCCPPESFEVHPHH